MTARCFRPSAFVGYAFAACAVASCASHPVAVPGDASVGSSAPMPTPRVEPNDAPPVILAIRFSALTVRRGARWSGRFVTGTSVASVEVRTNLFSIDVPHVGAGAFAYSLNVLDVPPIFVRKYRLRVIARNSAGVEVEQDLPFEIR